MDKSQLPELPDEAWETLAGQANIPDWLLTGALLQNVPVRDYALPLLPPGFAATVLGESDTGTPEGDAADTVSVRNSAFSAWFGSEERVLSPQGLSRLFDLFFATVTLPESQEERARYVREIVVSYAAVQVMLYPSLTHLRSVLALSRWVPEDVQEILDSAVSATLFALSNSIPSTEELFLELLAPVSHEDLTRVVGVLASSLTDSTYDTVWLEGKFPTATQWDLLGMTKEEWNALSDSELETLLAKWDALSPEEREARVALVEFGTEELEETAREEFPRELWVLQSALLDVILALVREGDLDPPKAFSILSFLDSLYEEGKLVNISELCPFVRAVSQATRLEGELTAACEREGEGDL